MSTPQQSASIFNQTLMESTGQQAGICATYDVFNPEPIFNDIDNGLHVAYNVNLPF